MSAPGLSSAKCTINFSFRWIYAQFIALDANFKLKLKNRQIHDPELGSGWSYFVENSAYVHHVASNPNEREVGPVPNVLGYVLIPDPGNELWYRIPRS